MKVSELKELIPTAEFFELNLDRRYIVKLPQGASKDAIHGALDRLRAAGLDCIVITGNVHFYEVS